MSQGYADERYDDPYEEPGYAGERPDRRRPRWPKSGLWLIIGGSLLSILLIYLAWSYNRGAPARLVSFSYTSIADPSDQALEAEVTAYARNEHSNLPAARKALHQEIVTELAFSKQLAKIHFPPNVAAISARLIQANQKRSQLIQQQAQAPTLARMRALDHAHHAADAAVEVQVRAIRTALGLPPPSTS
jgi:hypothetical protein